MKQPLSLSTYENYSNKELCDFDFPSQANDNLVLFCSKPIGYQVPKLLCFAIIAIYTIVKINESRQKYL